MESAGNSFRQSTIPISSPHKLTSYFLFYPLAYLLFLFLLILCLDEDGTVELTEQENHALSANAKVVPSIPENGQRNTVEPFVLPNPDSSTYPNTYPFFIPTESLAEFPSRVASP
ncbi:MAG: hypothetical protein D3923_03920 [Candidatus Electrothrix sp. AR3]|nr:hypothetical protein [Candidatus Electrothrix sp. AR3]